MAASVFTRDWEAFEMADLIGQHGHISVTGEVELANTGTTAELKEHTPPGFNPRILLLDLVIHREGGVQGHIAWFEKLTFQMKSSGDAYDEVDVLYGGESVQRLKVQHPLTFSHPVAKKTPAKKPSAGKKPAITAAPKSKPGKKVVKKSRSKPARKSAKKTAKKAVKKTVKKAAKKAKRKPATKKRR